MGRSSATATTVLINDFAAPDPLKKGIPEGHSPLHKFLTIPVFSLGNIVAVVGVANKFDDYNDLDIRQLNLMMDSVWKIVQRKKTEEAITISEARLKRAELVSKMGNWEFHLDSQTLVVSDGLNKLHGLNRAKSVHEATRGVVLPEYLQLVDSAAINLVENDQPLDLEYKIKTADTGEIKDIHLVGFFDREKRILFGVLQDITEHKKN